MSMISLKLVKEEDLKTAEDIERHEARVQFLQANLDEMNGTLQKAKERLITSSDTTPSIQHDDVTSLENQGIESVNQVDEPAEQVMVIEETSDGISRSKSKKTKSVGNNLDAKMAASTNQVINVPNVENSNKIKKFAAYVNVQLDAFAKAIKDNAEMDAEKLKKKKVREDAREDLLRRKADKARRKSGSQIVEDSDEVVVMEADKVKKSKKVISAVSNNHDLKMAAVENQVTDST